MIYSSIRRLTPYQRKAISKSPRHSHEASKNSLRRIYILLLAMLLVATATKTLQAASPDDATLALNTAQATSQTAYLSLRDAQLSGANTSALAQEFNQGLVYLQSAISANNTGNYNTAVSQAQTATQIFNNIQTQAQTLKTQATSQNTINSAVVIASSIASVALITFGFRFFEKWQHRRWLKKLPQMRIILKEDKHEDT